MLMSTTKNRHSTFSSKEVVMTMFVLFFVSRGDTWPEPHGGTFSSSMSSGKGNITSTPPSSIDEESTPTSLSLSSKEEEKAFREQTNHERRLLQYLMRNYDNSIRPVKNANSPVIIRLGITLTQIFDLDEKNQVLTTNVWLDQEWTDEFLVWPSEQFGNLTKIRIPCEKIWLPDIVLYNNADDYTRGYMNSRAMIEPSGNVFWPPPTKFRSTCPVDVTYFPFDDQTCIMKLGSWIYDGLQVDILNRTEEVDLSNYVPNGEWDLLDVKIVRNVVYYSCCPEPFPDVTITIKIRRKTLYYMYNVVFPCLMMSVLTLLVFCLPPDSGEKIALGVTVLLAFSVFMLAISEKLPETSESIPLLGIYLTAVMAITSVSVIMTVIVVNIHYRGPSSKVMPESLKKFLLKHILKDKSASSSLALVSLLQLEKKQQQQQEANEKNTFRCFNDWNSTENYTKSGEVNFQTSSEGTPYVVDTNATEKTLLEGLIFTPSTSTTTYSVNTVPCLSTQLSSRVEVDKEQSNTASKEQMSSSSTKDVSSSYTTTTLYNNSMNPTNPRSRKKFRRGKSAESALMTDGRSHEQVESLFLNPSDLIRISDQSIYDDNDVVTSCNNNNVTSSSSIPMDERRRVTTSILMTSTRNTPLTTTTIDQINNATDNKHFRPTTDGSELQMNSNETNLSTTMMTLPQQQRNISRNHTFPHDTTKFLATREHYRYTTKPQQQSNRHRLRNIENLKQARHHQQQQQDDVRVREQSEFLSNSMTNHIRPQKLAQPPQPHETPVLVNESSREQERNGPPPFVTSESTNEVLIILRYLLWKTQLEDDKSKAVHDWRLLAQSVDRILFWLFTIITLASSLTFLVFIPVQQRGFSFLFG